MLTHGCRYTEELAYRELITEHLPQHEYLGEAVRDKLIYYPTVTREKFENNGRLTDLLRIGKLTCRYRPAADQRRDGSIYDLWQSQYAQGNLRLAGQPWLQ